MIFIICLTLFFSAFVPEVFFAATAKIVTPLAYEDVLAKKLENLLLQDDADEEKDYLDLEEIKQLIVGEEKQTLQARMNEYLNYVDLFCNLLSFVLSPLVLLAKLKMKIPHRMSRNFYTVFPETLYRSRQLSKAELQGVIDKHKIKTVINLRGRNAEDKNCMEEEALLRERGIALYYVSINAKYLPSRKKVLDLITIFDEVKLPLLIHCKAGADRTSFGVALYLLHMMKKDKKEASSQFSSFWYGHNPRMFYAMSFFISLWQGIDWLKDTYDPSLYPKLCPPTKEA